MAELIKLSDYVIRFVANTGVKHVFFLPGGGAMHLNDSLGKCKDLEYVCNLHEQASAIAAEAYSKMTENYGVAMVTSGPGGTNAITGVSGAWLDSTPCMFLSGQVKRADLNRGLGVRQLGVQEIDIVSLVSPITKYAVTITDPESIRYHMEKAYYLSRSGRPGPVWIDIPMDVQAAMVDVDAQRGFDPSEMAEKLTPMAEGQLSELVAQVVELLNKAERPIILAGHGIRLAKANEDFLNWVERLGIPVLTTWLGLDLLGETHELFAGRPGAIAPRGANFALQNADFLLTIGARLDMAMIGYAPERLARGAKKVMVDIDPTEIAKMKSAIDIPVAVDAKRFLLEIEKQTAHPSHRDWMPWRQRCLDWKLKYPVVLPEHRDLNQPLSLYYFSEALSEEMTESHVISPGSSGVAPELFFLVLKIKQGQRCFHTRGPGAMGFGQPSSIGACLGSGRKETVCVDGDGGFQMNIQELQTISRLQLPIKFFVINNNGYASIRASQQNYFGRLVAADATSGMSLPDLTKVAEAYGVTAVRISDPRNLHEQIRKVLATPGPVVCDVVVRPDEVRGPRLSSAQRADGSMYSKPLEDLWPFLDREEFLANMLIPVLDE